MKIRKAKLEDVDECLKIQKLWKDNFFSRVDLSKLLKNKDAFFLVADEGRSVVGFITGSRNLVKREEAFLQQTMVHPSFKRKGIGKKLVLEFCRYLRERGIKFIFTELEKEHIPFYIKSCRFKDRGHHVLAMKNL